LRANFSPPLKATKSGPVRDLCGCQSVASCKWGYLEDPSCPCDDTSQFPNVTFAGGCAANGICYRIITQTRPCATQFNGIQFCTFDEPDGTCRIGDPTPTPTPDPTSTPTPAPTPTPTPEPCPQPKPAFCCLEHYAPAEPGSPPPCQWDCGTLGCPAKQELDNGCYVKSSGADCRPGYRPENRPGVINTLCCPRPDSYAHPHALPEAALPRWAGRRAVRHAGRLLPLPARGLPAELRRLRLLLRLHGLAHSY
jgi:hypothetical protein